MELRHLRTALVAAEEGSLVRAAARLHYSQQAVSLHLAALERDLGVRLFDRHRTGVAVTTDGVRLLGSARRVVELADELEVSAGRSPYRGCATSQV